MGELWINNLIVQQGWPALLRAVSVPWLFQSWVLLLRNSVEFLAWICFIVPVTSVRVFTFPEIAIETWSHFTLEVVASHCGVFLM